MVPTRRGPRKDVILPEKAYSPNPFPELSALSNKDIMTLLALWMVPKKIEIIITQIKNSILVFAIIELKITQATRAIIQMSIIFLEEYLSLK